jgi:hypothetical protein
MDKNRPIVRVNEAAFSRANQMCLHNAHTVLGMHSHIRVIGLDELVAHAR